MKTNHFSLIKRCALAIALALSVACFTGNATAAETNEPPSTTHQETATVAKGEAQHQEEAGGIFAPSTALQVWTLVSFLLLLVLLSKFALKPMSAALRNREAAIRESLAEADKARAEVKNLSDEAKKAVDAARSEGNKILDETRAVAENVRKEIMQKATAEAGELVQRAREDIERQKQKALVELRQTVADLSVKVTEQVIQQRLDEPMHRRLADDFIANLTKKK